MSYTRAHMAKNILVALGNLQALADSSDTNYQETLAWMCGWSTHEMGAGACECDYNLYGCGLAVAGSSQCPCVTSAHVQRYPNFTLGVLAMLENLSELRYLVLRQALESSDIQALSTSQEIQNELGVWISGKSNYSGYNRQTASFASLGHAHAGDTFSGVGGTATAPPPAPSNDPCRVIFDNQNPGDPAVQRLYDGCVACVANVAKFPGLGGSVADCVAQFSGTGNASPGLPDPTTAIANFLAGISDVKRDAKVVLGGALVLVAVILVGSIINGKVQSNPVVQTVKKTAVTAAKAAAV